MERRHFSVFIENVPISRSTATSVPSLLADVHADRSARDVQRAGRRRCVDGMTDVGEKVGEE